MIEWEPIDRIYRHRRTPRPRVKRHIAPPIPSFRALVADLPCTYCNAAPCEPCHGLTAADQVLGAHQERRTAALDMRRRLTGTRR